MTDVQGFYTRWAQLYDYIATAPGVRSWREHVVDTLSLSPGDTVVEMGCGTGANFPYLRDAVGPRGRVVGLDVVEAMLASARDRIDERGWENVGVVRGDATRPPIERADAIIATFLVGMLRDPGEAVSGWIDHLAPGGRIAIMNAGRSDRRLAAPLNLLFRLFVRASSPGGRLSRKSPAAALESRWRDASDTLRAETTAFGTERIGLGFVRCARGRRPADHS
ncbi:methyltransferase domain-containing protein [Halovenus sp. WSH3]|uniref:Methyltransferase domain-containing protein n=1 Tax=Halovenus carboxidivorans TaxID=2692199 RepID=A0A6B0T8T9_9EURY|nr:methyltransferase domain-containing protein [Halovenus carboxidivorans]MXR51280.1 methyltransferase domain-containing protein [Halovenus carboxidivorans]